MPHESDEANQPEGVEVSPITSKCLDVVERYRAEHIRKGDAILELTKTIPVDEAETAESVGKTLESYVSMLEDWDRKHTLSDANEQDEHEEEPPERTKNSKGQKRGDRDNEYDDDDGCDEPVHRRPKIDPGLFPWVIADKVEGSALRKECITTWDLIANYTIDIKQTKSHLLNSGAAPEFPDSEWKSVLSGLAVNLDTVFSGRYSTEHDPQITHEIGDFTISAREVATSKSVKSAGDWFIAWNQTAAVTVFAFPHRSRECQEYGKHILGLFAAFAEEHHRLIFNYDRAVRKRVALQRDLLLTDLSEFGDLRVQFLNVRGANSAGQVQANSSR